MLTSTEMIWFQSGQIMTKQFLNATINVLRPSAFESGDFQTSSTKTLGEIKRSGFRIIMLMADNADLNDVTLAAS